MINKYYFLAKISAASLKFFFKLRQPLTILQTRNIFYAGIGTHHHTLDV